MVEVTGQRVVLVGIDYFPYRGSSDKNFWHEMIPELRRRAEIEIISFNYRPNRTDIQDTENGRVRVHNVRPAHLGIDLRPDPSSVSDPNKCHAHFKRQPRSLFEYSVSLLKIRPLLNDLLKGGAKTSVVHFLDNFGPAMRLVRRLPARPRVSASAMGYYARGRYHDRYLRLSFTGLDAVVPYSRAYADKLISIGLPKTSIRPILWGICPQKPALTHRTGDAAGIRRRLNLPQNQRQPARRSRGF